MKMAMHSKREMPLMDDSDDEEMQFQVTKDQMGQPVKKQRIRETDDMETMFDKDGKFFKEVLEIDRTNMTDSQYVQTMISNAKQFFNIDRGSKDLKHANLGDIKSTKIESPYILNHVLYDPSMSEELKKVTPIKGNVKAMVPILREKFALEYEEIGCETKQKYKKLVSNPIKEKRIFGIMTAH